MSGQNHSDMNLEIERIPVARKLFQPRLLASEGLDHTIRIFLNFKVLEVL